MRKVRHVPYKDSVLWESASLNIDRENAVIKNVKIIGKVSKNGRQYSDEALTKAVGLYEGKVINIDHPDRDTPNKERGVMENFGWLEGVRFETDGLYGDLQYYNSHPAADFILERAERNPRGFGLSHNADGRIRRSDNTVEVIEAVRSVDLVGCPATTAGLFESVEEEPSKMATTLRKLVESHGSDSHKTNLDAFFGQEAPAEEVKSIFEMEVEVSEPGDDVEFPALLNESLAAVAVGLMGQDGSAEEKGERMRHLAEAEDVVRNGIPAPPAPEPENVQEEVQQLRAQLESYQAREKARELLEAKGITPKGYQISAVAAITDGQERTELIESFVGKGQGGAPQKSPPKHQPPASEDEADDLYESLMQA